MITQGRSDDEPYSGYSNGWVSRDGEPLFRVMPEANGPVVAVEMNALLARAVAAEAREAQLREVLRLVRVHVEYSSSPTMGRPSDRDARDFAMDGAPEQMARYALQLCIDNSRQARSIIDAALAAASGVAPDKPAQTECNDERCVLPGAHDLGEFGCLVDPGVALAQPSHADICTYPGCTELGAEYGRCHSHRYPPWPLPDQPNGDKR